MAGNPMGELVMMPRMLMRINKALTQVGDLRIPFTLIATDWYKDNMQIANLQGPGMYPDFKGDRNDTPKEQFAPRGRKVKNGMTPYMVWKQAHVGFVYPLLKLTGAALDSITIPGGPGSVRIIGPKTLVLGSSIEYLIYHQSSAPRTKMPYRPVIFNKAVYGGYANVYQTRMKRYNRIIQEYLKKAIRSI
jgi:hypothetical protein